MKKKQYFCSRKTSVFDKPSTEGKLLFFALC